MHLLRASRGAGAQLNDLGDAQFGSQFTRRAQRVRDEATMLGLFQCAAIRIEIRVLLHGKHGVRDDPA